MALRRRKLPPSILLPPWWRRHAVVLGTVAALAGAVVCERSGLSPLGSPRQVVVPDSADPGDQARYHDRTFRVVHVVDGDTVDIDAPDPGIGKLKTRIRLWGVDCPEVGHGRPKAMHFGPEATAYAEETLGGREVHVVLSPRQTRDKFGRLLAYVFLERGGAMFNEMLVENGFAYADPRWDHPYERRLIDAESRARHAKAGLWAAATVSDMPKWRQKRERDPGQAQTP